MNPMTALGFVAIFAGLGVARKVGDAAGSLTVMGGVFLGSGLWWVILSAAAALLHRRLDAYIVVRINRLIGLAIAGVGGWMLADALLARSEEHTSELHSLMRISYAVFCLKKKNTTNIITI